MEGSLAVNALKKTNIQRANKTNNRLIPIHHEKEPANMDIVPGFYTKQLYSRKELL